jgi:hypothetical protein
MYFKILGQIAEIETIAKGKGIKELDRLNRTYGRGRWRKLKGMARVRLENGTIRTAEVHLYEAHGLGRYEDKIKRYLD